jgi:hypothetical protein
MLFENQRESALKACAEMVETVLAGMGQAVVAARMASDSGPAWRFERGSAHVFIFLTSTESGDDYIQVVSPILRPDDVSPGLYPRLLELNANQLTGAAFGLREGNVVVTTDRSTTGLDRVEVDEMIRRVSEYADHYDDLLHDEFGGTRYCDLGVFNQPR